MKKILIFVAVIICLFTNSLTTFAKEMPDGIPEGYTIAEIDYHDIYSDSEIEMLEKLTQAEGGNQSQYTQTMIALVVLNRTKNDNFPDTIEGVIFQKGSNDVYQFSCISDGNYKKAQPTDQVKAAVDEALYSFVNEMRDVPDELLFFNSTGYFNWSTVEEYEKSGAMYFSTLK